MRLQDLRWYRRLRGHRWEQHPVHDRKGVISLRWFHVSHENVLKGFSKHFRLAVTERGDLAGPIAVEDYRPLLLPGGASFPALSHVAEEDRR